MIDQIVICSFLALTLIIGLYRSKGVNSIAEYALGGRNFSTATLAATIIATWISGSFFAVTISEVYKEGMWFVLAGAGDVFSLLITGCILGPRLKGFFGNLSVAETMGKLFGRHARIMTAFASVMKSVGFAAVQVKVFSLLFSYFFGMESLYATIVSSVIVVIYSTFGGIRAVTITDVFQFIAFGVFIPMFALFIWKFFGNTELLGKTIFENKLFDYHELTLFNPKFWPYLILFIHFATPSLNPTMFQRMLMAKSTDQIRNAFSIAAIIAVSLHLILSFIAVVLFSYDSSLDPGNLAMETIGKYFSPTLKIIAVVSIMAMIMSSADSSINAASVMFAHDLCKPIGIKILNELKIARVFAMFSGIVAIILALSTTSILKLILLTSNFYQPIITVPMLLSIFGFRSSARAMFTGVGAAIITVIFWKWFIQPVTGVDSVIPAMLSNLIVFLSTHYILKEPGGWTQSNLTLIPISKSYSKSSDSKLSLEKQVKKFYINITSYLNSHIPKYYSTYIFFAFAVFLTLITTASIDNDLYNKNIYIIDFLQGFVLLIATAFISNELWPKSFRQRYLAIVWYSSVFICLAIISSFLVLLSNFSHASLTILTLHLTMISLLMGWRTALVMIISGVWLSFMIYQNVIGITLDASSIFDLKLKLIYVVIIVSMFMLTLIKSKQYQEFESERMVSQLQGEVSILGEQVVDYNGKLQLQEKEIARLGETAQRILNNVNHELRLPVGNVMNFAEMLSEGLGKYSEEQLKELSDEVVQNTNRLSSMILNMLDLATLDAKKIELDKSTTNLSRLVGERAKHCFKLYKDNKPLQFKLDIEPEILVKIDPNYIRQTVDNLVINAINYSKEGTITVTLRKNKDQVIFTITDEGLGIPASELYSIFEPFQQSSKTTSKAEGRGVGLALCKAAVEAHGGVISAESNGKGARFRFVLSIL